MKKIGLIFSFCAISCFGFSQVKVVAPNGHTGIGPAFTTGGQTPAQKLHVDGNALIKNNLGYTGLFVENATGAAQVRLRSSQGNFVFDDVNGNQQAILGYNGGFNRVNIQSSTSADISIVTNNKFLWWAPNGSLGVGTSTPSKNLHVVGNAGKTDGTSTWDVISDKRLKKNINDYQGGLEEILQIRPVTFQYDGSYGTDDAKVVVGVVAQEVEKVAPYMVHEVELVDAVAETKTREDISATGEKVLTEFTENKEVGRQNFKSINNDAFTYMLINSVQEQQKMIDQLTSTVESLNDEIESIKQGNVQTSEITLSEGNTSYLEQNIPNPYHANTKIRYNVSSDAKTALIKFFNANGQLVKSVNINPGVGVIDVNKGDISTGNYSYSLIIDGKLIDTKKMVITQ